MSKGKAGKFGKFHENFILDNYDKMSPAEMAEKIEKTERAVSRKMAQMGLQTYNKDDRKEFASADIRNSAFWKQLKAELTNEELDLFVEHWKEIISQFRDDILHTEKLQVMDLVKTEILMSRDLANEKVYIEMIHNCKKRMNKIENDDTLTDKERQAQMDMVHNDYGINVSLQKETRNSFQKLQDGKKHLIKELKASRNQRLERIENSKETIQSWIIKLMTDVETRKRVGIKMEKMRLAMDVEYERLTDLHKFSDGEIDIPINNSEVALRYGQEKKEG